MLNSPIASSLATQAWIDSKRILERQISILEFADISDRAVAVKEFRYIMGGYGSTFSFCLDHGFRVTVSVRLSMFREKLYGHIKIKKIRIL